MLMFRSPSEKTPGFYAPKITNDGFHIGVKLHRKRNNARSMLNGSFPKQKRFLDYKFLARITSKKVGPGTYKDFECFKKLRKKPCTTKIRKSTMVYDINDPSYMYIGNHLVHDPDLNQNLKRSAHKRSNSATSLKRPKRECKRLCYTLQSQEMNQTSGARLKTAKIRIRKRKPR